MLPDERRFLLDEALEHMLVLEPGSVGGERVEFVVDGKPVVEGFEWAREKWRKVERVVGEEGGR